MQPRLGLSLPVSGSDSGPPLCELAYGDGSLVASKVVLANMRSPIPLLSFWSAWHWASHYRDLSCVPTYLGICSHEPRVPRIIIVWADSHNGECRPIRCSLYWNNQVQQPR